MKDRSVWVFLTEPWFVAPTSLLSQHAGFSSGVNLHFPLTQGLSNGTERSIVRQDSNSLRSCSSRSFALARRKSATARARLSISVVTTRPSTVDNFAAVFDATSPPRLMSSSAYSLSRLPTFGPSPVD